MFRSLLRTALGVLATAEHVPLLVRANNVLLVCLLMTFRAYHAGATFCASDLCEAACADYANESEDVFVSFEDICRNRLTTLPFVNRLEQLGQAADALLHNKQLVLSAAYDPRQLTLVFSSHLFGAGKTAFARRLHRGLDAAFHGKMYYALSMGVPADASSIVSAIARLVVNAAECAHVLTFAEAEALRTGSCEITSVVHAIQVRLVANECGPTAISELFLHMDKFDLSHSLLLQAYPDLRTADVLARYDYVLQQAFCPIMRAPNLHLVITGRSPELAILGTRSGNSSRHTSTSPTLAFQAVLGTLHSEHILDVLRRLKIQTSADGSYSSALDVLGFQGAAMDWSTAAAMHSSADSGMSTSLTAFLDGLRHLTAGVPRYVCLALAELLQQRVTGKCESLSTLDPGDMLALFMPHGSLSAALVRSPFVHQSLDELGRLISKDSALQSFVDDFYVLALHLYSGRRVLLHSVEGGNVIRIANKFCAYVDFPHDRVALSIANSPSGLRWASGSNPEFVVSLPGISEHLLRTPQMASLLKSRIHKLTLHEVSFNSLGAVGEGL